jgi:hypothetical protein
MDTQAGLDIAIDLATIGETAGSVTALLKAAGVSSAAGPAGWIVAGTLVVATAIVAFVGAAKRRTMKVEMVAPLAQQYGFPQAVAFPDFVLQALQENKSQWRKLQASKLERKIAKGQGKSWENTAKLQFLGIVEVFDMAEKRIKAGLPMVPATEADVKALQRAVRHAKEGTKLTKKTRELVILGGATIAFVAVAFLILDD